MREPVSRFVSTLRFVKRLGERFGNDPQKLVQAIQRRGLPDGDANTFCNNVAWVLRGERASLAYGPSRRGPPLDARRGIVSRRAASRAVGRSLARVEVHAAPRHASSIHVAPRRAPRQDPQASTPRPRRRPR